MPKIHFSVDDTINCFKYLSNKRPLANSIFESRVLNFAKIIHETYNINVSFYCMFTNGNFTLEDVPTTWTEQFDKNSDWLKFGFHCYGPQSNYSESTGDNILYDYDKVICEMERITGGRKSITDTIRIHLFSASGAAVHALRERGVKMLLCADDDRISYCLKPDDDCFMKNEGVLYSEEYEISFAPSDIRIENIENVDDIIRYYKNKDFISVFTHEKYIDDTLIIKRINRLFEGLK